MSKERKNLIFNYVVFAIEAILSIGGVASCCLAYGHGLGDILYLIPLWLISVSHLVLFIIAKVKRKNWTLLPFIYTAVSSFFVIQLIFNKGPECGCDLFNSSKADEDTHLETIETNDLELSVPLYYFNQ